MQRERMRAAMAVAVGSTLAAAGLYAVVAAVLPFYDKGEPREALVVRGLRHGGGLVLPRPEGGDLPSKPPLFHWLAAAALVAGVTPDELAIRGPSVAAGAVGVGATAGVTTLLAGAPAGAIAAAVLGSSFEWMRAATQARVDMLLAVLVVAAAAAWLRATRDPAGAVRFVRAGWLCATAAVLTKGPVGVVLPLLVVVVDAVVARRAGALRAVLDPLGVGLATLACGGWYLAAWRAGGAAFTTRQLLHENVDRFLGRGAVAHRHGVLYYVPALAGGLLPWTPALPAAWRRWRTHRGGWERAAAVSIGVVLAFYAVAAGKRSVYLLPLYPPLAVLLGAGLADGAVRPSAARRLAAVSAAAAVAVAAVSAALGGVDAVLAGLQGRLGGSDAVRLPAVQALVADHRAAIAVAVLALAGVVLAWGIGGRTMRVAACAALALVWSVGLTVLGTAPVAAAVTAAPAGTALQAILASGADVCARGGLDHGFRWYAGAPVRPCGRDVGPETVVVWSRGDAALGRPRWFAARAGETPHELGAPASPLLAEANR